MNEKIKSDKKQNKQELWLRRALLRDHYYIPLPLSSPCLLTPVDFAKEDSLQVYNQIRC